MDDFKAFVSHGCKNGVAINCGWEIRKSSRGVGKRGDGIRIVVIRYHFKLQKLFRHLVIEAWEAVWVPRSGVHRRGLDISKLIKVVIK